MKNVKERKTQVRRKVEANNKKYTAQKNSVKRKKKVKGDTSCKSWKEKLINTL